MDYSLLMLIVIKAAGKGAGYNFRLNVSDPYSRYWKGKNRKAIFVEVGERENDESMILALRYKTSDKPKRKLVIKGRYNLVGMRDSRIYG